VQRPASSRSVFWLWLRGHLPTEGRSARHSFPPGVPQPEDRTAAWVHDESDDGRPAVLHCHPAWVIDLRARGPALGLCHRGAGLEASGLGTLAAISSLIPRITTSILLPLPRPPVCCAWTHLAVARIHQPAPSYKRCLKHIPNRPLTIHASGADRPVSNLFFVPAHPPITLVENWAIVLTSSPVVFARAPRV
jgi:hypothetical protein